MRWWISPVISILKTEKFLDNNYNYYLLTFMARFNDSCGAKLLFHSNTFGTILTHITHVFVSIFISTWQSFTPFAGVIIDLWLNWVVSYLFGYSVSCRFVAMRMEHTKSNIYTVCCDCVTNDDREDFTRKWNWSRILFRFAFVYLTWNSVEFTSESIIDLDEIYEENDDFVCSLVPSRFA